MKPMQSLIVAKACRRAKSRSHQFLSASTMAVASMLALASPHSPASELSATTPVVATATVVAPVSVTASLATPAARVTESSGWVAVRVVPAAAPVASAGSNGGQGSATLLGAGTGPTIALRVVVQSVQPDAAGVQSLIASGRSGGGTVAAGERISGAIVTALSLSAPQQAGGTSGGSSNYSVTVAFN